MPQYVALLRGIAPTNPNMRNDKLRGVFEGLGFDNVKTVISSGNVVFASPRTDAARLEADIEHALTARLGIRSATILRSRRHIQDLVARQPFGNRVHSPQTYLTVTFLKNDPRVTLPAPYRPDGKPYDIVSFGDKTVCAVIDTSTGKTPDYMGWLERQLGPGITTRTWKTVERILRAFD